MGHFSQFYRTLLPHAEDVFIETGTFKGESVRRALEWGFREVHSVEVCQRLYEETKPRFELDPRVHLYLGSSPGVLERILTPDLTSRYTACWLDGHYQGYDRDEMDATDGECPLLAEIDVILSKPWSAPLILAIDDIDILTGDFWRTPMAKPFSRREWPTLEMVKAALSGFHVVETEECVYAWRE